jgi:beta-xylosidase
MVFGGEMVDEQGNVVMQTNGIAQGGIVETPDGKQWQSIGDTLQMHYDIPDFCGQRFMLFNFATQQTGGIADFDWFHVNE